MRTKSILALISTFMTFMAVTLLVSREGHTEADSDLACLQVTKIGAWSETRYGGKGKTDFKSADFAGKVGRIYLERLDPNRLLFTGEQAEGYTKEAKGAWSQAMGGKCDFFKKWAKEKLPDARAALVARVGRLPIETIFAKHAGKNALEMNRQAMPHYKTFAKDEKELASRLGVWADTLAAAATPAVLAAYGGDKKFYLVDSLEQLLFEESIRPVQVLTKAMLNAMDPFSTYFSSREFEDFYYDLSGGTTGIGLKVRKVPAGLLVEKIVSDSSAGQSKKIFPGDVIEAVNGVVVKDLAGPSAKGLLRGLENSKVTLHIRRAGKPMDVALVRRHFTFEEARVKSRLVKIKKGKAPVAVIDVPSFYGRGGMEPGQEENSVSEDLKGVLTSVLNAKKKPQAIVLDLRGNPGGFLEEAVTMAGLFMGDRPVVGVVDKDSRRVLRDTRTRPLYSGPLVVLVDQGTASASEVLAGALKDNGRAIVVGAEHTYGKGSVQKLFHLDEEMGPLGIGGGGGKGGGVVKLTTSVFYSPLGHSPANGGVASQIKLSSMAKGEDDCPACSLTTSKLVPEETPFLDEIEMRQVRVSQFHEANRLLELQSRSAQRVKTAALDDELATQEAAAIAADQAMIEKTSELRKARRDVVRY